MTLRAGGFQCGVCQHFISWISSPNRVSSCAAFLDGIPEEIIKDQVDHRQPYAGDHGIRWQLADDRPADTPNPIDVKRGIEAEARTLDPYLE